MNYTIPDSELSNLVDTLEKATIRCSSPKELIARLEVICEDPYSTEVVSHLLEISLSPEEQTELEKAVRGLISVLHFRSLRACARYLSSW